MNPAEELRELRREQQIARRMRRTWEAALGGRSSLPSPTDPGRRRGFTSPPAPVVTFNVGEIAPFQFGAGNAPVALGSSIDYPVQVGGIAHLTAQLRTAPTADIEVTVYRNGASIGTLDIPATEDQVEVIFPDDRYLRLDRFRLETTDAGADGMGLAVVARFLPSLEP